MTNEHPHRRKILGAISAGLLAVFGGCYLITNDDGDEDVGGDREENETAGNDTDFNETDDPPQDPNETDLTTNPDIYDPDTDDC